VQRIQANQEIVPRPANMAGTQAWDPYRKGEMVFVFDDCVPARFLLYYLRDATHAPFHLVSFSTSYLNWFEKDRSAGGKWPNSFVHRGPILARYTRGPEFKRICTFA